MIAINIDWVEKCGALSRERNAPYDISHDLNINV